MKRVDQDQINSKKTAINGHLDHRGCQSWNNSFGFNNKPGNYVPTLVIDQTTGAMAPVRRAAQQLLVARGARLRPGEQSVAPHHLIASFATRLRGRPGR